MALYGPNDDILNDPNIQFLMGKINPTPPTLAPQPAPYAMPTAQPKPPAWLPSADATTPPANIAGPTPAPPPNVVAPAPVNQDMAGLIPTRDTQNPHVSRQAQLGQSIADAQRDKNLNPRWWERLIAAASTGAQAYANGGHATPGMMEMAANINNRRRNAVIDPLQTEYSTETEQANQWNKAEDDNYRARHDAWNSQMQVSRDRQTDRRLDLQDERDNARQALDEREAKRKEQADANSPAPNVRPELRKNPDTGNVELMVRTKSGAYIPYTPKSIDEGAMLGDKTALSLFNREHPGNKPPSSNELGLTPAQYRQFMAKYRTLEPRINILKASWADAKKNGDDESAERLSDALDRELEKVNGILDEVQGASKSTAKPKTVRELNRTYGANAPEPKVPVPGELTNNQPPVKPAPSKTSNKDFGPAPQGSPEGRTGKLDGTPVVVKNGRIVAQ